MKFITYTILISITFSCTNVNSIPNDTRKYLQNAIDLIEKKSVNKNRINWAEFHDSVFEKAKNAKTIEDTYPAISFAISKLNDNHSYFRPITEFEESKNEKPLPVLSDETTPEDIGYIRLPFCIGKEDQLDEYISSIQTKINRQSKGNVKGWIIDLRGNFGGNMWPMLLAIEPLIGNGIIGYFVDADNKYKSWKLINGKAFIDDQLVYENKAFENLNLSNQYVAVLTDNETASSGEAVAIALKSRNNSMSFGTSTYGVSTGCVSHLLSDGSTINLAESVFADRNMNKYGFKVIPDIETNENDALINGILWIYKMNENHH
jgi:carboxyl-terminal processing protease